LDTGATHASYIDKDLVDRHRKVWKDRIRALHAAVKFGDNKTSQEINEIVMLPLRMEYQNLTYVTAGIEFCAMLMPGRTMIVGLPDLIEHYCYILLEILHTAKQDGEDYNRNIVVDEEQDARGMNDEYAENEMFNIMVLSLIMGKYLSGDRDELLSEDGNGVIYAVVKKELSKDVDDKSNVKVEIQPPEYYMKQVHGGRKFHHGSKRTWRILRAEFPGINTPLSKVVEFVEECPICQKLRIAMVDQFKPLIKHLKPDHHRRRIGLDQLSMTPADNFGHDTSTVIVDHFSKHLRLYLTDNHAGKHWPSICTTTTARGGDMIR
jgi:hypothetical protein